MTSEILMSSKLFLNWRMRLSIQHLQHVVLFLAGIPKKKSNTGPLATHSFCDRPAHLPKSFTVSVDQVCSCSWVWCLGLQTDRRSVL